MLLQKRAWKHIGWLEATLNIIPLQFFRANLSHLEMHLFVLLADLFTDASAWFYSDFFPFCDWGEGKCCFALLSIVATTLGCRALLALELLRASSLGVIPYLLVGSLSSILSVTHLYTLLANFAEQKRACASALVNSVAKHW